MFRPTRGHNQVYNVGSKRLHITTRTSPALSAQVTPVTTFQHPPTHSLFSYILCKAWRWDFNISYSHYCLL